MYSLSDKWEDRDDDSSMEKVDVLEDKKSIDPLGVLNRDDMMGFLTRSLTQKERFIIAIAFALRLRLYAKGDPVIRMGGLCDEMFIVYKGLVALLGKLVEPDSWRVGHNLSRQMMMTTLRARCPTWTTRRTATRTRSAPS